VVESLVFLADGSVVHYSNSKQQWASGTPSNQLRTLRLEDQWRPRTLHCLESYEVQNGNCRYCRVWFLYDIRYLVRVFRNIRNKTSGVRRIVGVSVGFNVMSLSHHNNQI